MLIFKWGVFMKILHTSDWHLGKNLEGETRLYEQKQFIDELYNICENENVDIILMAGDVYDTVNPSSSAEELFYKSVKKLAKNGKRPIIIIAGNHDNPERLEAADILAYEHGIIILGFPKSIAKKGDYENYSIIDSCEGFFRLKKDNETVGIITMPYPSEKRLGEILNENIYDEEENGTTYSQEIEKIFKILEQKYNDDEINIAMGHFFVAGGEESGSERPIQLGGALAVEHSALPQKAQYIALGHLHKPQTVSGTNKKAFYSGSPIEYNRREIKYSKSVNIIDIQPKSEPQIKKVNLTNYKPIEEWKADSIEEALEMCRNKSEENSWVYLTINSNRVLLQSEIKEIKKLKKDIIEISVISPNMSMEKQEIHKEDKNIIEQFKDFYIKEESVEPSDDVLKLFMELMKEEC